MRGKAEKSLFSELRETVRSTSCDDVVEVMVESINIAKKVKGFLSMSGCDVEILNSPEYFVVKMKGKNCNCV